MDKSVSVSVLRNLNFMAHSLGPKFDISLKESALFR